MKAAPNSYLFVQHEMAEEAAGLSAVMEVDDADPLDVLSADFDKQPPLLDADFFNTFDDDFDDSDIA